MLGRREKDLLRLAAERVARSMSADAEMMVLRSEQYHKRMNLMGDLASWACWTVHLRTPQLDIGVIATRRKYIPPVGDQYQDIFIVQTDDVESGSPELFMQGLERQVRATPRTDEQTLQSQYPRPPPTRPSSSTRLVGGHPLAVGARAVLRRHDHSHQGRRASLRRRLLLVVPGTAAADPLSPSRHTSSRLSSVPIPSPHPSPPHPTLLRLQAEDILSVNQDAARALPCTQGCRL